MVRCADLELIQSFDNNILYYILENWHNEFTDSFFKAVSSLGNRGLIWIIVSALMLCSKKWRSCGIVLLLSLGLSAVIGSLVIKNLVCRLRPFVADPSIELIVGIPGGYYSFPSGHSTAAGAASVSIFLRNRLAGAFAFAFALLMSLSRVFLAVHYPTDTICGLILGALCAVIIYKLLYSRTEHCLERLYERRSLTDKSNGDKN